MAKYRQDHRNDCRICGYKGGKGAASLTTHIKKVHGLTRKEYYDEYVREGDEGICRNCGKPAIWQERMFVYAHCCSQSCHVQHLHRTDENFQKVTSENISKRNKANWKKRSYRKKMEGELQKARDKYHEDPKSIEVARKNMVRLKKDPAFEEKRKKAQARGIREYWNDPDSREAASLRASKCLRDPDNGFGYWSAYHRNSDTNMRSYHEVKFAELCDNKNIPFRYEPKTFKLKNGRRYTPDFYLPWRKIWIEIKIKSPNSKQVLEKKRRFKKLTREDLVVLTPKMFEKFFQSIGKP